MYRILAVDDEVLITMQLARRLTSMGYEVVGTACSGAEAMEKAELLKPDVILMDIVMPGQYDGIDAAEKIGEELDIPVVFLTAYADDKFVERAKSVQPFGYVVKPYQEREIKAAIEVAIYKKDMERKLRKSQEVLQESEAKYRALVESTNDFIWEMDLNGVYTYCSPQMEKLWGFKPEDMLGKTPFDLLPPEDREQAIKAFSALAESSLTFTNMETRSLDGTGSIIFLEISGVPFFDIAGKLCGYRGITRDITERKRAEEAMRESEVKYRLLFEESKDPVYITTRTGSFIDVNQSMLELIGYTREEIMRLDVRKIYANAEDRARYQRDIEKIGSVKDYALKLRKKDGTEIDGLVSSTVRFLR